MPAAASAEKARAGRALGAAVVLHGADLDAARERAERLAADDDRLLVSPGDTPALLAGVAPRNRRP
jgi:threonine dehydratase